jgi:hypothetical protein
MKHEEDNQREPSDDLSAQHQPREPMTDREARNKPQNHSEESLSEGEREAVNEHGNLSALSVYAVVLS